MSKLKNITANTISLQMFTVANPAVNSVPQDATVTLQPGQVIDEAKWLVANSSDVSYNADLINEYILRGVLTRI